MRNAMMMSPNRVLDFDVSACSAGEFTFTPSSRVLITGAAGFIGNTLALNLAKSGKVDHIVGLDNYSPYYSVAFKRARAERLLVEAKVEVVDGDVCNSSLIDGLLDVHRFTHIVHLAAQAGVRYSLRNPMSYVRENVECFVELLEAIRRYSTRHPSTASGRAYTAPQLTYASSSSVYGMNRKIPFSESDPVEMPANLYGATKRSNELIAFSYHHLHKLPSVGLRFFTVYGPWGRPDMAAYIFSRAVELGEPLTVYNGGKMRRDFTFVDDIVSGISAAMQYCSRRPGVFNLGNNEPVGVLDFIRVVERVIGRPAVLTYKNSSSEIDATYADISKAKRLLDFSPLTSIDEGMEQFAQWYLNEPRRHEYAGGLWRERRR